MLTAANRVQRGSHSLGELEFVKSSIKQMNANLGVVFKESKGTLQKTEWIQDFSLVLRSLDAFVVELHNKILLADAICVSQEATTCLKIEISQCFFFKTKTWNL